MIDVYCSKCGSLNVEKMYKLTNVIVESEDKYFIRKKANLYKCKDCNYELVSGVEYNE